MPFKGEQVPVSVEENIEKLKRLEQELSIWLKKEGIPVDENCRISMDAFETVYPYNEIINDKRIVSDFESGWYKDLKPEEVEQDRLKHISEQFEVLKTIIFNKFFGQDFIVVRASFYDDIKNGVDNVILEKKTGNLVCAIDEVSETSGKEFEDKKEKVLTKNMTCQGGKLKYGLTVENDEIIFGAVDHFPLFYLALPPRLIKETINNIGFSFEEKTEYERKLFLYFLSSIDSQIKALGLYSRLNQVLKNSVDVFGDAIDRFKK
jgi:hypothetical protein